MEERFLSKVNKTETCWIWISAKNKVGYGYFGYNRKVCKAHRISYELYKGQIPKGLVVRHICNNPSCVNPNHLEVGTYQDNSNDMKLAGRQPKMCGIKNGHAKLTEEQVRDIRNRIGQSLKEIGNEFGVRSDYIKRIIERKIWKCVI